MKKIQENIFLVFQIIKTYVAIQVRKEFPFFFHPPQFLPTQNNKYLGTESDQANLYYTESQEGDHLRSAIGIYH